MQLLLQRLHGIRPDIKSFLLVVHEMCAEEEPVQQALHEFSGFSADDPQQAGALLYPHAETIPSAAFDPLSYVQQAADQLQESTDDEHFSYSGPMPSYTVEGKEVTRRFDCAVVFVDSVDLLPPPVPEEVKDDGCGCC